MQHEWGRVAQAVRAALQWEVAPRWFVTATANAGDTRENWRVELDEWVAGWGLSVGHLTVLGPARGTLAGRDTFGDVRLSVELGRVF